MVPLPLSIIVIATTAYLSFVMALAGWFSALRKGQAVTLLPEQGAKAPSFWLQVAVVALGLVASVALGYFLWIAIPIALSPSLVQVVIWTGFAAFFAGSALILWARRTLGAMWGISTSRQVKLISNHKLIASGPYRVVRHPMYSGWLLALAGLLLMYRTWFILVLLISSFAAFTRRARLEEKVLAQRFGTDWSEYSQRTRAFIPFIY
jgi:protein-S-isoprenylcysteine O-methyltransferase Ste14